MHLCNRCHDVFQMLSLIWMALLPHKFFQVRRELVTIHTTHALVLELRVLPHALKRLDYGLENSFSDLSKIRISKKNKISFNIPQHGWCRLESQGQQN